MTSKAINQFNESYYTAGTSNYKNYKYDTRFIQRAYDIDKYLQPRKVLEVGCALGYLVRAMRVLGIEAFGYDVSDYAIKNADPLVKEHVRVSDGITIPFHDYFDLVVAFDVLEHIPEPEVYQVLYQISQITDAVFLCQPNFFDPWDRDQTHVTLYPKEWWADQFASHGFKRTLSHPLLTKFNYTNGILLTKSKLPGTEKTPKPLNIANEDEKNWFAKCNEMEIF